MFVLLAFAILVVAFWWQTTPPSGFPINSAVTIARGLSASAIAEHLEDNNVVRSNALLYFILIWKHDPNAIQAGTFVYTEPLSVFEVAERLTEISVTDDLISLTLPEGYTVREFADIVDAGLPDFDSENFLTLGKNSEGYMFPDTYYVPIDFNAEELSQLLLDTYQEKTADIKTAMASHPLDEYGVLILASLLEREANSAESMRVVSGILQTRMDEGMRLQVDASLEYVLDRPLNTLTPEDLEIDSPYNTYLYDGLPPTPIGNPGLVSINAVLDPIETEYLYYLTDEEGTFHYARTFDEHRENIAKYLR